MWMHALEKGRSGRTRKYMSRVSFSIWCSPESTCRLFLSVLLVRTGLRYTCLHLYTHIFYRRGVFVNYANPSPCIYTTPLVVRLYAQPTDTLACMYCLRKVNGKTLAKNHHVRPDIALLVQRRTDVLRRADSSKEELG